MERQFEAFAKGFLTLCGGPALQLFSATELVRGQLASAEGIGWGCVGAWPGRSTPPDPRPAAIG